MLDLSNLAWAIVFVGPVLGSAFWLGYVYRKVTHPVTELEKALQAVADSRLRLADALEEVASLNARTLGVTERAVALDTAGTLADAALYPEEAP